MKERQTELGRWVGAAIARRRASAELTQGDLAERLGVTLETISRFERGAVVPTLLRLSEIAQALGCGLADLLGVAGGATSGIGAQAEWALRGLSPEDQNFLLDSLLAQADQLRRKDGQARAEAERAILDSAVAKAGKSGSATPKKRPASR